MRALNKRERNQVQILNKTKAKSEPRFWMEKHLTCREEMEICFCLSKEPSFLMTLLSSTEEKFTYLRDLDHKPNQIFNDF